MHEEKGEEVKLYCCPSFPHGKTKRYSVANSRAFLKKHLLKHESPFHGGACEWYNIKFIEYHHLYVCEGVSRFTPFLNNFYSHANPVCYVQASGFD
ncbi:hypothetical protein [Bartonella gliris]|uniref:hypothetical protein n=1 Tax=Bartonella gliris TaxID=3004109 RepID=UPI00295F0DBA|nr:hypothetical protein [Bartonella gliris]